ncbi:hypothetical protein CERSUDRAFT_87919 [Gelatoporia subvermispora B]|uniref:Secreted protein n=1 Tax=Ceriporiopsis subvermispora (strain B) TaxID=914234 RepID=M2R2W9_CERS8|nr:hypothetical protein CERSUDRAFT_87919 [Gelatoporia subvermispora B]
MEIIIIVILFLFLLSLSAPVSSLAVTAVPVVCPICTASRTHQTAHAFCGNGLFRTFASLKSLLLFTLHTELLGRLRLCA